MRWVVIYFLLLIGQQKFHFLVLAWDSLQQVSIAVHKLICFLVEALRSLPIKIPITKYILYHCSQSYIYIYQLCSWILCSWIYSFFSFFFFSTFLETQKHHHTLASIADRINPLLAQGGLIRMYISIIDHTCSEILIIFLAMLESESGYDICLYTILVLHNFFISFNFRIIYLYLLVKKYCFLH